MIIAQLHDGRLFEMTGEKITRNQKHRKKNVWNYNVYWNKMSLHRVLDYSGNWWLPENVIKCIWRSKN